MIDSLKLSDEAATAIVGLAIAFETFTDGMPETEKDRLQAAHDTVAYAIDAYVTDGVRSDSNNEDRREAGHQVEAILKVAGVKIGEDDAIEYGKALTGARLDKILDKWEVEIEEVSDDGKKDEAAFDIDDIIDGYEELTPASRIKAIKKLELDPDDDDDAGKLNDIADWEEEQDKPASRVLSYIEELLAVDEDDDDGKDDKKKDDDEPAEYSKRELTEMDKEDLREVADKLGVEFPKRLTDAGRKRTVAAILEAQEEGPAEEAAAEEEPWDGYDDAKIKDIKAALEEAAEDDDDPLTAGQVDYTIAYEKANDDREALIDWLQELRDELAEDDEPAEEPEPEPEPEKKTTGRRRRRGSADPDDSDDADDAVARDDEKESRSSRRRKTKEPAATNGLVITLTRDQIVEALTDGEVTFEVA